MENLNNGSRNKHLEKIKYKSNYKVNESPTYRQLVDMDEEFDEIPVTEADEEIKQKDIDKTPETIEAPVPEFDKDNVDSNIYPDNSNNDNPNQNPSPEEQEVDDIQNEIIKHNINAMKSIYVQLENLNDVVDKLNNKIDILNSEVEEVREPTNSEKLMNKTKSSHPYYYNLNDFWSDNWFNEKMKNEKQSGIRELPDGTYIADFDDLPSHSKVDIQNSFNEIV